MGRSYRDPQPRKPDSQRSLQGKDDVIGRSARRAYKRKSVAMKAAFKHQREKKKQVIEEIIERRLAEAEQSHERLNQARETVGFAIKPPPSRQTITKQVRANVRRIDAAIRADINAKIYAAQWSAATARRFQTPDLEPIEERVTPNDSTV
jgi:hypothetical protein